MKGTSDRLEIQYLFLVWVLLGSRKQDAPPEKADITRSVCWCPLFSLYIYNSSNRFLNSKPLPNSTKSLNRQVQEPLWGGHLTNICLQDEKNKVVSVAQASPSCNGITTFSYNTVIGITSLWSFAQLGFERSYRAGKVVSCMWISFQSDPETKL